MHPLLYLWFRQTLNSLRRALTSPRRLIGILFLVGYYMLAFRPFQTQGFSSRGLTTPFLHLPATAVLQTFAFGLFLAMTVLFLLGLTSYRGGHKPADIDVLFPTPLSPKVVLAFRMFRDSLINLMLPFVLMLFSWRPASGAWTTFVRDADPNAASMALKLGSVSYFLMAAGWVALGYALSLYCNRPGRKYDRIRALLGWGLGAFALGTVGIIAWLLQQNLEAENILATFNNPILRTVFFLPNAAADFSLAPLTGDWGRGLGGLAVLIGFLAVCVIQSLRQAEWLYEIAAQRVSATVQTTSFAKKGDSIGLMAHYARSGKLRVRRLPWINRLRVRGAWALVWKDVLINTRGFTVMFLLFPVLGMAMIALITFSMSPDKRGSNTDGFFITFMIGMMTLASASTSAQSGFVDMLMRVDTLKPLPYSPGRTMMFEVVGKAVTGVATALLMGLVALIMSPAVWAFTLGGMLLGMSGAVLISACIGLTTVLFPDIDDPSQRSFRGIVQLLVLAIFALPPLGMYVGLVAGLKWSPALAALPSAGLSIALAWVASIFAGQLFASFNPSE